MKQSPLLLFVLCSLPLVASADAQEFLVVTSSRGYLLSEDDQVARTVPFMTVLDVVSRDETYLTVENQLRIHRAQVQASTDFDYMKENLSGARQALQTLSQAFSDDIEPADATQTAEAAIQQIKAAFPEQTPATAWFLQFLAWIQYDAGDLNAANATLDAAETLLEELGQLRHLHAADVFNTRALIRAAEGDHNEAIRLFHEALLMQTADLGADHLDGATVRINLTHSYDGIGDTAQAARNQLIATRTLEKVLPPAAIELPESYTRLADFYNADGRHREAIALFENANALYRRHHPDRAAEIVNTLLGTGDAYELLNDVKSAEQQYDLGFPELDRMEASDAAAFRKAIINRKGRLAFGQDNFEQALIQFSSAADLYDPEAAQSEDADTFEQLGNTYAAISQQVEARQKYIQALKIYADLEGETSESVLRIDELIGDLDGARDGSLDDVVMVPELKAYMFDDDSQFLTAVPELTVLDWNAFTDETETRYGFYTAPYGEHFGNVDATQLRRRRMLPGYFETSSSDFKTAVSGVARARLALQRNDTQSAAQELANAVRHCQTTVGDNSTLTLWVRMFEIRVMLQTDGPDAAAAALVDLQDKIQARSKGDYPIEMDAKALSGALLMALKEPAAAAEQYRSARTIAVERLGNYHVDVVDLGRSLSQALLRSGDVAAAATELRSALAVAQNIYPTDVAEVDETKLALCLLLTQTEDLDDARERLQAIIADAERLSPQNQILADVLLGRVNMLQGRVEDARPLLNQTLERLQQLGAETSPPAAAVYSDLGRLAMADDDMQTAVEHLQTAVTMHQTINSTNTFEYGKARLSLGIVLAAQGKNSQAREQFTVAVQTLAELNRSESPEAKEATLRLQQLQPEPATASMSPPASAESSSAAKTGIDAATDAFESGRFDDAKQIYAQILQTTSESAAARLEHAAASLGLAKLSATPDMDSFDAESLTKAIDEFRSLKTEPALLSEALLIQAFVLIEQKEWQPALDLLQNELLNHDVAVTPKQLVTALCLKSRALAGSGQTKDAIQTAQTARRKVQEIFGALHIYEHSALEALGNSYLADGDELAAERAFQESRQILRLYLNDTVAYQPFERLASFLTVTQKSLHEAVSPLRGGETMTAAVTWVLNEKNLLPAFAAREQHVRRLLNTDDETAAYNTWKQIRTERAALPQEALSQARSPEIETRQQKLREAEAGALANLPSKVQTLLAQPIAPSVDLDEVRKALKPDELLIEIIRLNASADTPLALDQWTGEDYFAWIIPPAGDGFLSAANLGNSLILDGLYIDSNAFAADRVISSIQTIGEAAAAENQQADLRSLARQIWEPLSKRIPASTKTIIFSLDGDLQHVPWAALPVSGGSRLLIDDYAIQYVSSGRELLQRDSETSTYGPSLILADPDFDTELPRANSSQSTTEDYFPPFYASPLPGTRVEASAVLANVTRFVGAPPKRLFSADANQSRLLEFQNPRVMHLATHGVHFQNEDHDAVVLSRNYELTEAHVLLSQTAESGFSRSPLQRCGLMLAGCNSANELLSRMDGILTGEEIVRHDLSSTELVVLSQGPGDAKKSGDADGATLLPQAFRLAGARTVIAPIWDVSDGETSAVMISLYQNLAGGMSKAEALRQAQLAQIRQRTDSQGAAHPFFWAAFRVNGLE